LLRGLRERLSEDDYWELDNFVRKNINGDFHIDWFRSMVKGEHE
jgi:hypothetical protein